MALPDDSRIHHRGEHALAPFELGLEFDYRLYWLRTPSGRRLAVMVNVVDTACRLPELLAPWRTSVRATATLTTAIFDVEATRTWQGCQRGTLDDGFRFQAQGGWETSNGGEARVQARGEGFVLDLTTQLRKPAALFHDEQGKPGTIVNGELGPFEYVMYTALDAQGTITIEGRRETVAGSAWRDRQWMTRKLVGSVPWPCAWRWFALQLTDPDCELMLYEMWNTVTGRVFKRFGGLVDAHGRFRHLASDAFRIDVIGRRQWEDRDVESEWRIELSGVAPGVELQLARISASPWIHADAGLFRHDYIEGPCRVSYGGKAMVRAWAEQVDTRWIGMSRRMLEMKLSEVGTP